MWKPRLWLELLEERTLLSAGTLDMTFGIDGLAKITFLGSQTVHALAAATQSDGKLVVVGDAESPNGAVEDFALVRYNTDGSLDTTFDTDGQVTTDFQGRLDGAAAVAVQADGKIVVGGASGLNNQFALARYNSNGSLDTSFGNGGEVLTPGPGQNADVILRALTIQPDNKILAAGRLDAQTLINSGILVRYNANGTLDTTFGTNGILTAGASDFGLILQSDGKPVVLSETFQLTRFTVNGGLDTTFGSNGVVAINFGTSSIFGTGLALQSDGKLVALGTVTDASGHTQFGLARVNASGTLDMTFGTSGKVITDVTGGEDGTNHVAIQTDGKIVASGFHAHSSSSLSLARFNSDGSLDVTFGSGGKVVTTPIRGLEGSGLTLELGQIVQVGVSIIINLTQPIDFAVVRYTATGSPDPTFGTNGVVSTIIQGPTGGSANKIAVQADGKIVQVGTELEMGRNEFALARFNADGTLDATFGTNSRVATRITSGSDSAQGVLIQPDDKILVVGQANVDPSTGFSTDYGLVRYNPDGSLDATFGSGGIVTGHTSTITSQFQVALQAAAPNGAVKILVDGGALVRYNPDGFLDSTFGSAGTATHQMPIALAILVQPDGKIVEGGQDGDLVFAVARYTSNGQADVTFGSNGKVRVPSPPALAPSGSNANALTLQSDGKIVAVGGYATHGNSFFPSVLALVRLNVNGGLDKTFGAGGIAVTYADPSFSFPGLAVVLQLDNRIVIADRGGELLRYNPNGLIDATFGDRGHAATSGIFNFDVQVQGDKLLTGAEETQVGSVGHFVAARYTGQTSANEHFVAQAYVDLLRRLADPAGLAFWAGKLDQGMTRTAMANAFTQSTEYRTILVRDFYQSFLHRAADPGGLANNVAFWNSGATVEQVKAQFIGSAEYFQTRAQNNNDRFLDALYSDILGRAVDPTGRQAFRQAFAAGASRTSVALAVLTSKEAYQGLVGALYVVFLRRPADSGGLNTFVNLLQQGTRLEAIIAMFIGSDEYFSRV